MFVRRTVSRHPDDLIARTQQGPIIARTLWHLNIHKKIGQFLCVSLQPKGGKLISRTTNPQFERSG